MSDENLPEFFEEYSLTVSLPFYPDARCVIPSFTSEGTGYELDLNSQTCSCPDFTKRRGPLVAPGMMGRFCKHLIHELSAREAFAASNKWIRAIADAGHGGPHNAWQVCLPTAQKMLVTTNYPLTWINVFAHTKRNGERVSEASGPIKQFGWKPREHRWSYGEAPPGARELRHLLMAFDHADYEEIDLLEASETNLDDATLRKLPQNQGPDGTSVSPHTGGHGLLSWIRNLVTRGQGV